jgi:hypothetical protein
MAGDLADGIVLWSTYEVDLNDLAELDRDDLIDEVAIGPDRRLYLTRSLAERAVVAELREELEELNREEMRSGGGPGVREMPEVVWRDVEEGEGPAQLDTDRPSRVWVVGDWDRRYYVVAMVVQGRPVEFA